MEKAFIKKALIVANWNIGDLLCGGDLVERELLRGGDTHSFCPDQNLPKAGRIPVGVPGSPGLHLLVEEGLTPCCQSVLAEGASDFSSIGSKGGEKRANS
ncbi:hypothetical protein Tco_0111264 [Tanacetum coccineum]